MIEVENLTKYYGKLKALDNINLRIEENEVFGFLGPNGAGKTTTINLILGLIQPTSGKIKVAGYDVLRDPIKVKTICGYLPENAGFYPNLTARQNLEYFSEFYGIGKEEAKKIIEELLELVGLGDAIDRKVGGFSRGMKQRLGLAQALLNDPEIVFLDEPTTGLDPAGATDFRRIIKHLKKDGKTIFFSSHILSEVREVCETIGIINKGRIVAKGRIEDFKSTLKIQVQTEPEVDENLLKKFGEVSYNEESGCFVIEVEKDCRSEIAKKLFEMGYVVKELHLLEPSLEEIYFRIVGE